jgi:hypothetical protein
MPEKIQLKYGALVKIEKHSAALCRRIIEFNSKETPQRSISFPIVLFDMLILPSCAY